jgi:Leucine-rich repeat (LRR) protein
MAEDSFSKLPNPVLCMIHGHVCEVGGLPAAMALEATSMHLCSLFRGNTRFPDEVAVAAADIQQRHGRAGSPLRRWLAVHGHRVRLLAFKNVSDGCPSGTQLRVLCNIPGVARAGAVSIDCVCASSLRPLLALTNLQRLVCRSLFARASAAANSLSLSLQPLASLTALQALALGDRRSRDGHCTGVTSLAPLARLTALTILELSRMPALSSLSPLSSLGSSLEGLFLTALPAVTSLAPLAHLTRLEFLNMQLVGRNMQHALQPLGGLQQLLHLQVGAGVGRGAALDLHPVSSLTSLISLRLSGCQLSSLQPLATGLGHTLRELLILSCDVQPDSVQAAVGSLRALVSLELEPVACSSLAFLQPLANLRRLTVGCGDAVHSLEPIRGLTALRRLHVTRAARVGSLEPLRGLSALLVLQLDSLECVSDLRPLGALTEVRDLTLTSCPSISDLTPLGGMTGVRDLTLMSCPSISDLTPLGGMTAMTRLSLASCPLVKDLAFVEAWTSLMVLKIDGRVRVTLSPLDG